MRSNDRVHAAVRSKVEDGCCPTEKPSDDDEMSIMPMMAFGMGQDDSGTELDHPTLDETHSQKWYEAPRRGGDAT